MGFNLSKFDDAREKVLRSFIPLELNEGNVQAIFNRCLAKFDGKEYVTAIPFTLVMGYSEDETRALSFEKDLLAKNKRNIEYLYGQLYSVHTKEYITGPQSIKDLAKSYTQEIWTQNKGILHELIYLASNEEIAILLPFNKKLGDITRIRTDIKPTLSPKDPNFPAWWEQHKSEWEDEG